jgi:GTPase SAR1 family protein
MIDFFKNLFKQKKVVQVYDVFTPTRPATYTFVEREKINNELLAAIKTPGKQLIVYGHSGSGKSTLLLNKLRSEYSTFVVSRCTENTTFKDLIADAFDQFNSFYLNAISKKKIDKIGGELGVSPIFGLTPKLTTELGEENEKEFNRAVPFQVNERKLAEVLKKAKCCWIVEDFHKVPEDEKRHLSNSMKLFMDMEAKVVAIGAVGAARQVIELNREMYNRVAEIYVDMMTDKQLEKIIELGEKLLNIQIEDKVKAKIIKFSNGLASVCHQLCLNICLEKGITETLKTKVTLTEGNFREAIKTYVSQISDTLKSLYDKCTRIADHESFNYPEAILKSMLHLEKDEMSFNEIHRSYQSRNKNNKLNTDKFREKLEEFTTEARGTILIYDGNSNKYFFSNPFLVAYCFCSFQDDFKGKLTSSDDKFMIKLRDLDKVTSKQMIFYSCYNSDLFDEVNIESKYKDVYERIYKLELDIDNLNLEKGKITTSFKEIDGKKRKE